MHGTGVFNKEQQERLKSCVLGNLVRVEVQTDAPPFGGLTIERSAQPKGCAVLVRYGELLPKCTDTKAVPMCDLHGVVHRQRVQQFHKGCAGGWRGYVEVENDIIHGKRQAAFGLYGIVILQRGLSSPFALKYGKAVLLDIGQPLRGGLPDGEGSSLR